MLFLSLWNRTSFAQAVNDYGAISSGTWSTVSIWRQWDGTGWNTVPAVIPNSANNVFILTGSTVTVPSAGSPFAIRNLTVQNGAKLYTNNTTTNIYISVYGPNIICDGEIGNGATFDGIGFNFEATSTTITGVGTFTASRFRKTFTSPNATSALVVAMNITLRWDQVSGTALYNNTGAASNFNVTVNFGYTLNCAGSVTNPANVSMDDVAGTGAGNAGGTIQVNGTMIVAGTLYATTNNTANPCNFIVGTTGVLRVGQINSPASATLNMMVFTVQSGGRLELTNANAFNLAAWSTTNNRYNFQNNSTVEYAGTVNQTVLVQSDFFASVAPQNQYANLVVSGSGIKTIRSGILVARGNITITGAAILNQNTNSPSIQVGGNWTNYNQSGFTESVSTTPVVSFYSTAALQTITCPGGEIFTNMSIIKNGTGIVQMNNAVNVKNRLTLGQANSNLSGILDLNGNRLTIENPLATGITLIGNTGIPRFIISEDTDNSSMIRWLIGTSTGTYVYPLGISTTKDTIPFIMTKTDPSDIGYAEVATYGTPADNLPWPSTPTNVTNLISQLGYLPDNRDYTVDRFWQVNVVNTVPTDITFTYNNTGATELPTADPVAGNMLAQWWSIPFNFWRLQQLGTASVVSTYSVTVAGNTVYNTAWTLTSNTSPLPIELLRFDARDAGDEVHVNWITATEINNDYFTIERGDDGHNFYPIGKVAGAGNSSSDLYYEFTDEEPLSGVSYYRLRQTDFDGKTTISDVVAVDRSGSVTGRISLFPNPANGHAWLAAKGALRDRMIVRVFDMNGREVLNDAFDTAENSIYRLDLSRFSTGIYTVSVDGISVNERFRLVNE